MSAVSELKGWLAGKFGITDPGAQIIETFRAVQGVHFVAVRQPDDYEALISRFASSQQGSCTPKHISLWAALGDSAVYVASRFLWSDLEVDYPKSLRSLAECLGQTMHLYLEYSGNGKILPGKVATLDATWDPALGKVGFVSSEPYCREDGTGVFLEGTPCRVNHLDKRFFESQRK